MANSKKFVVKNGLQTQNVDFVSADGLQSQTVSIDNAGLLSFNGNVDVAGGLTGNVDANLLGGAAASSYLRSDVDTYFNSATDTERLYVTNAGNSSKSLSFSVDTNNSYIRAANNSATTNLQFGLTANSDSGGTTDLSTATYDNVSFSTSASESSGTGLVFNSNGTRMFISGTDPAGRNAAGVSQYSMTIAYDIATASYDSVTLDVSAQAGSPQGIEVNSTGTKLYVADANTGILYQYSLSPAFDLSSGVYDSVSADISAQAPTPTGLHFTSNGETLYVSDISDTVYQYSLSTAFDLSTATYSGNSVNLSTQVITLRGISLSPDGTKLYAVDSAFQNDGSEALYQYTLSTPYNISTATYDTVTVSVGFKIQDIEFSNNGTKFFIVSNTNAQVYQYSTSTTGATPTTGNIVFSYDGTNTTATIGGSAVITQADTGSGNGLDADTVDGIQGTSFLRSDEPETIINSLTIEAPVTFNSVGNVMDFERDANTRGHIRFSVAAGADEWEINTDASSNLNIQNVNATGNLTLDGNTILTTASSINAATLEGQAGAYYLNWTNITNKPDPTITLGGDLTGSVTLTDLASGTLTATVVDDSHNHIIANVDGLQTALDGKIDDTEKGVANGVATLDGSGLVPAAQLPSFVDDVLEYSTFGNFPGTGETGKIYVAGDTGDIYRWSGVSYVKISDAASTADEALRLATARTITLIGDVTGSTSFDGSANVNISATVNGGNANTLDSLDSTAFLRSNANDTYTGSVLTINNSLDMVGSIRHSGDADTYLQFNAADTWRVVTNNTQRLSVTNTGVTVSNGDLTVNGQANIYGNFINFITGTDARIEVTDQNPTQGSYNAGSEFIFYGDGISGNAKLVSDLIETDNISAYQVQYENTARSEGCRVEYNETSKSLDYNFF